MLELLAAEKEYLTGDWTLAKVLMSPLVPASLAALVLAFWKRSLFYGLAVINPMANQDSVELLLRWRLGACFATTRSRRCADLRRGDPVRRVPYARESAKNLATRVQRRISLSRVLSRAVGAWEMCSIISLPEYKTGHQD